jgi:hypothetical protein
MTPGPGTSGVTLSPEASRSILLGQRLHRPLEAGERGGYILAFISSLTVPIDCRYDQISSRSGLSQTHFE